MKKKVLFEIIFLGLFLILTFNFVSPTTNVSDCNVLAGGETYTLNQSISFTGSTSCFSFSGDNVILDCQGNSITGDNSSGNTAVYSLYRANITIKNCLIKDVSRGIRIRGENNFVINNTITILASTAFDNYALDSYLGSINSEFKNNTLNLAGTNTYGITNLGSGIGTYWDNITINADGGIPIYADGDNETFNRIHSTQESGTYNLYVRGSGNIFTNSFFNGTGLTYGTIYLASISLNTTIRNTTIYSYNTDGIRLYSENNFIDCQGASIIGDNTDDKIGFYPLTDNNVIKNCIISNFSKTVYIDSLSGELIDNVTATSVNNLGITLHIKNSNNITISNSKASITASNSSFNQAALRIETGSYDVNIINSTFNSTNGFSRPVEISRSTRNNFTNVETYCQPQITGITGSSFFIYYSNYTILNNVTARGGYGIIGIYLAYGNYNLINNSLGIANDTEYLCKGDSGALTNNMGIAIFSNSNYNNLTNSRGISQEEDGIAILNSSNNIVINSSGTTRSSVGIYMVVSSSNNSIINSTGTALGNPDCGTGFAMVISDDSNNNLVQNSVFYQGNVTDGGGWGRGAFAVSNAGATGLRRSSSNNTLINNIIYIDNGNAMTVTGNSSTNNTFRNNTVIATGVVTSIYVSTEGNIFCLNNLSESTGVYVNDTNSSNFYNCTYDGKNQGNIYPNVVDGSVSITGIVDSSISGFYIGSSGSVPYNNANSLGKVIGSIDYAPLTIFLTSASTASNTDSTSLGTGFDGIFKPGKSKLEKGYSVNIAKGQKVEIVFGENNEKKIAKVKSVDASSDKVVVLVNGNNYEINSNSSGKIDLDDDGFYDVEIINNGVTGSYANLEFTLIHEEVLSENEEEQNSNIEVGNENEISFWKKIWNFFKKIFDRINFWSNYFFQTYFLISII